MAVNEKEQFKNILNEIQSNSKLVKKLVIYLENNNLLEDLYSKLYYMIEKSKPIYKIKYYKNKTNGRLLNMNEVKNSCNSLKDNLEEYIVYVYDEIKTLNFMECEINRETIRRKEYSKTFDNLVISMYSLELDSKLKGLDLFKLIKENPLLFVYTVVKYNINVEELKNVDEKSFVYKKEIKKN